MKSYDVKRQMKVAEYQWKLFSKEYDRVKAGRDKWLANQKQNAERFGLNYLNYEDLYNDYIIGAIDRKTFILQKKLYNRYIADNRQRAEKLEWLGKERDKYGQKYESLKRYYEECKRREKQVYAKRHYKKVNGYRKRYYDPTRNISKYNFPHYKERKQ